MFKSELHPLVAVPTDSCVVAPVLYSVLLSQLTDEFTIGLFREGVQTLGEHAYTKLERSLFQKGGGTVGKYIEPISCGNTVPLKFTCFGATNSNNKHGLRPLP